MRPIPVIVNTASGSFVEGTTDDEIVAAFKAQRVTVEIHRLGEDDEHGNAIDEAVKAASDIVVVSGGDGTVSSVAAAAAETGKTLGILPAGTLNHFARDLNIPVEIADAAKIIVDGHTEKVDIGQVNGRTFVNNSSIGLYPRIVRRREVLQERLGSGKWSAALFAAVQALRRGSLVHVRLRTGDTELDRKTPFVFVGNNEYHMDLYNIGKRVSLRDGRLSVYFLHRSGRWGVVLLMFKTLFGSLDQASEFESLTTTELTIETKRKKTVLVALDGEVAAMQTPLCYRVLPRALSVFVPAARETP